MAENVRAIANSDCACGHGDHIFILTSASKVIHTCPYVACACREFASDNLQWLLLNKQP